MRFMRFYHCENTNREEREDKQISFNVETMMLATMRKSKMAEYEKQTIAVDIYGVITTTQQRSHIK